MMHAKIGKNEQKILMLGCLEFIENMYRLEEVGSAYMYGFPKGVN